MDNKRGAKNKQNGILRNYAYLYHELIRANKWNLPLVLMRIAGNVAEACLILYLPKRIVQLVTNEVSLYRLMGIILFLGLLLAAARLCRTVTMQLKNQCLKLRHVLEEKVLNKVCSTPYSNLEDPDYRRKIDRAKELYERWDRDVCECIYISLDAVTGGLKLIIFGSVLITLHPLVLAAMIVSAWIQYKAGKKSTAWTVKYRDSWQPAEMKLSYIMGKICDFGSAKDLRLYAADRWLMPKYQRLMKERMTWSRRELRQKMLIYFVVRTAQLLQHVIIYWFLIRGVLSGGVSGDQFVLYVNAALTMSSSLFQFGNVINGVRSTVLSISDYRSMLEEGEETKERGEAAGIITASPSITLSHVHFSYPGSDREALKDIDVSIRPGEKIAIVGLNGAGKTTLVKLLCGLYRPTEGQIRIDGVEASNWELSSYYRMFSAVFQDFTVMPSTIAENVAGCSESEMDREKVERCLKQAGLWKTVQSFPDGIHSRMPKELFRDGINLSGGETQKLLLARAIYKEAPILLLDEPTAALDAIAENELYLRYHELTKNRTSVYISHRLSSTRFCDRILMMKDGQVIEEGSHEELLAQKGEYFQLFQVQSHYYQNDRTEAFDSTLDPAWEVNGYVSE